MGSSAVLRSTTHLEKSEIEKLSSKNKYINAVFSREKNVDGFLTIKELNNITNGLLNDKILKKIIQICGSKKDKLTYDDFCYFYSLLITSSFEAKLNFLLDFIFIKKDKLSKEKYINKINKYFYGSHLLTDIFLEDKLLKSISNFTREEMYSYIEKNHKKDLENYSLYLNKQNINLYNSNNSNENYNINTGDNINNENTLILINNTSKENSNTSVNSVNIAIIKNQKFESLSSEFKNIEKQNKGVFPISLFEDMLREIDVDESLIEIIGDYLKKKTHKSFFNFDLFKEILSLLIIEENNQKKKIKEISKGLFILISYPKNYINKKMLINLFKNEQSFGKKLDNLGINAHIDLNQFIELYRTNNIFTKSLEHIQYLGYIFFNEKFEDHSMEYNCFIILTKEQSMDSYILERLQYDNDFYLIDIEFWNKWSDLINEKDKIKELGKLRINTKNFCDSQGKIQEGKNFPNDYVILSQTMYSLFLEWYGPPLGPNIVRYKIYLDDENTYYEDMRNSQIKKRRKKSKYHNFTGIEEKTHKKFELELNPIFILFYDFVDYLKNSNNSMGELKHRLRRQYRKEEGDPKYKPFSRKTKFKEFAKKINNHTDLNNIRFFAYFNDRFEVNIQMDDSLEDLGMQDKSIILVEEKLNNRWLSENLKKDNNTNKSEDENDECYVGLYNIGNTCYMNSILQIFLNIEELRDIFIPENDKQNKSFLSFVLNTEYKDINNIVKKKGYLIIELINLLKEKWFLEKKALIPRKFKEICGEYNSLFKTSEQQDAHDFYTFLVDKLHEETNIKARSDISLNDIENSDTIDTNEIDLGNESWANNIRKNASYFYALFMGQLKSTLICSECNTAKIKFEAFSSLEIPIPEGNNIIIEIILFRLPYSLRNFNYERLYDYEDDDDDEKVISSRVITTGESINVKKKNKKNKKTKSEKTYLLTDDNTKISDKNTDKNEVINNLLNLNIPIKLRIEVNRKEKCSSIIDKLKCMSDINIEKHYNFTEFIMISKGKYINEDLKIDETFSNNNTVFIYELLNINGIINICNYEDKEKLKIIPLKKQEIKYKEKEKTIRRISTISKDNNKLNESHFNLNIPSFYFTLKDNNKKQKEFDEYEILISIIHRVKNEVIRSFITINNYHYFFNYQDFIILSSSNSIKPFNLYEIMWKKYMYFLNCPSNYDNKTWWLNKKNKNNLPFIITIINKDTSSCALCPWFRFCSGCSIDPFNSGYININSNCVIVVEWDKEVYIQEINKNNLTLIMSHSSSDTISDINKNNNDKISIYDCLKLFTKSEEIKDIQCEKCKKKTLFKKTLEIERLPKYLVLVLKRFKYILTNTIKIQNLINFPLEELQLQDYVSQKNIKYKYNLFGVINHLGSLESGHYYSYFNINTKFMEFDDSQVNEVRGGVETNKAYMLIYKSLKTDLKDKNLNLIGLMDRAYSVYLHQFKFKHIFNYIFDEENNIINEFSHNCEFYYGEPVTIDGKIGFIINITKAEDNKGNKKVNFKIKIKKGFFSGQTNVDKIIKETYKKPGKINIDLLINEGKENQNKKNIEKTELICGSQVCLIF